MYNRFLLLSSVFVHFYAFHKSKSITVSKMHKGAGPSRSAPQLAQKRPGRERCIPKERQAQRLQILFTVLQLTAQAADGLPKAAYCRQTLCREDHQHAELRLSQQVAVVDPRT